MSDPDAPSATTVLVLGLGDSGLAMARWCARRQGVRVRVWDSRAAPPQAGALRAELPHAVLLAGELDAAALDGVACVYKSPGLGPLDHRLAALLSAAREQGVPVRGELDLFAQALDTLRIERGYAPRVIAITGTNGKTTTTSLTGLLVERAGRRVAVAGNIGPTMLDTLGAAIDAQDADDAQAAEVAVPCEEAPESSASPVPAVEEIGADEEAAATQIVPPPPPAPVFTRLPDVWVLELSSFQLEGVQAFEPDAAVVLNLTQDHLDWHGTMAAYAAAKARIYGANATARTTLVINRDDPAVEAMVPVPVVPKAGARGARARPVERRVVRFGLDAPRAPGDYGLVTENGMAWLVRALERDETVRRKPDEPEEIVLQRLMPADALRIRGRHNAANALAALALATAIGLPLAPMLHGLRDYRGEPHRVEPVARVGDVEFFDDSKGTNVGATAAALEGLGADRAPSRLVVILGGDGKGQDFEPLAGPLRRHARAAATLGQDASRIEAVLQRAGVPFERHASLEDATRWAGAVAKAGDAVLLSPACASFDMFRNYAHRAQVFVDTVHRLAEEPREGVQPPGASAATPTQGERA